MYIMCVCLFSALSRRVGALQISIIIIMSRYGNGYTQKIASVNTAGEVNELNNFFNRFDCNDFSQKQRQIHDILNRASAEEDHFQRLNTNEDEIRRAFQHVNPSKATGPDNIAPRVLKACESQQSHWPR